MSLAVAFLGNSHLTKTIKQAIKEAVPMFAITIILEGRACEDVNGQVLGGDDALHSQGPEAPEGAEGGLQGLQKAVRNISSLARRQRHFASETPEASEDRSADNVEPTLCYAPMPGQVQEVVKQKEHCSPRSIPHRHRNIRDEGRTHDAQLLIVLKKTATSAVPKPFIN